MTKKNYKPHMMYKGSMKKKAMTYEDHLRLKKLGYVHTKPKAKPKKTVKKTVKK